LSGYRRPLPARPAIALVLAAAVSLAGAMGSEAAPRPEAAPTTSPYEVRGQERPTQQKGSAAGQPDVVVTGSNDAVSPSMRSRYPVLYHPARTATTVPASASADDAAAPVAEGLAKGYQEGRSAERAELRTRSTSVYDNPDGTQTTVYGQAPLNYRDDAGRWQTVSPGLTVAKGGGWSGTGDSVKATLPETLGGDAAPTVDLGDHTVSWTLVGGDEVRGRQGRAAADGVTYPGVLPGVDVRLGPVPGGVKEAIILHDRATPRTFDVALDTDGLTPRLIDGAV
jgi:hypothetical protein